MTPSFESSFRAPRIVLGVALGFAALAATGCGGSTVPSHDSAAKDASSDGAESRDTAPDASADVADARDAVSDASASDAGCAADPVMGAACTPGVGACSPGNLCCEGEWTCDATSRTWTLERGGCACPVDAGSDASIPEGGVPVTSCASCTPAEICVVTVSGGGPCLMPNDAGVCPGGGVATGPCCDNSSTSYRCDARPTSCGQGLSCGCAMSLCQSCMCQDASAGTDTLICACEYP